MAKTSGLGAAFYVGGYDLSGDVGAIDKIASPVAQLDVTGIDKSAVERIPGMRDAGIDFSLWKNFASNQEHGVLSALPRTDVQVLAAPAGTTLGNPVACMLAKQINYDWTRAANGALSGKVQSKSNGYALEWGYLLTAGKRIDTAATNGTGIDRADQYTATKNIASVTVANPGQVNTVAPHGLQAGTHTVLLSGTTTTPDINSRYTATVTSATQVTVPVNVTSGQAGVAGALLETSTNFGASAYLQTFSGSGAGTDVTVKVQGSPDNSTYADITGLTFTQITALDTPSVQRVATTSTLDIPEYTRVVTVTTGGFTRFTFAVAFCRNYAASVL